MTNPETTDDDNNEAEVEDSDTSSTRGLNTVVIKVEDTGVRNW